MDDSELIQAAVDYITEYNHVTFVELRKVWAAHIQTDGDHSIVLSDNPNVILWAGVSDRFCRLYDLLLKQGVRIEPASPLAYLIDGGTLNLPVVKRAVTYKTPHWLPVVLCRAGTQGGEHESKRKVTT